MLTRWATPSFSAQGRTENSVIRSLGQIDAPLKIYRNIGEAEVETVVPMLEEPEEGVFYWKVRKFLDAVKEGGEAPVPTSQAIYNQAILDGIYRSAQIGHEIELEIPEV